MDNASYYEQLTATVGRIARHAGSAVRQRAVDLCLRDIDRLRRAGRITGEQADLLRRTLVGSLGRAA